jgi:hypothetical protein
VGGSGKIMADMTNEEYAVLDEKWTQTTPKVNFSRPGIFAQQRALHDNNPTKSQASASEKKPSHVIDKLTK